MRALERPIPRRGLSRVEAAAYIGVSPSKFDELRKASRIARVRPTSGELIHGDPQACLDRNIDRILRSSLAGH